MSLRRGLDTAFLMRRSRLGTKATVKAWEGGRKRIHGA